MTGRTANKIAVAFIAVLAVAAMCTLVRWALQSPNIAPVASVSDPRLIPPSAPIPAKPKPPAFRVELATVPGAKKLPGMATVAPAHQPKMPDAVQFAPTPAANVPDTADTAGANYSDLEIALHPSLKYRRDSADGADVRTAAALELPTVSVKLHSGSQSAPAKPSNPSAGRLKLIDKNLDLEEARRFVMSMCTDQQGRLWVGSEEDAPGTGGVQCFDPSAPELHQWTKYTTADGLGDNNGYAIARDRLGRIWVGHLNHGVSVFNGQRWQNYEVVAGVSRPDSLGGPLGERVFAISVCPTDGDVWMATDYGLSRYSETLAKWIYYGRLNGLPSDQTNALAFDKKGNIYVGTQCDGIAMADSGDDYARWRTSKGPEIESTERAGVGLPSNLINDMVVDSKGTIYAATDGGLGWSHDSGATWSFLRGADWKDDVRGRENAPPIGWDATPGRTLAEDATTSIAEDPKGNLLLGHRTKGWEVFPSADLSAPSNVHDGGYVTSIQSLADDAVSVGGYGNGLLISGHMDASSAKPRSALTKLDFPVAVQPPSVSLLKTLGNEELAASTSDASASYLSDDWTTQGDWVGRFGQQAALLCGAGGSTDHAFEWGSTFRIKRDIGRSLSHSDSLRSWITTLSTSDNRSLWDLLAGARRQSEWDDHGEAFRRSQDGPNIKCTFSVPSSIHRVSLYFVNTDGHTGSNNTRDYFITLNAATVSSSPSSKADIVTARAEEFWSPVYKSFLITRPGQYVITIHRNRSLNTIVSGIFIDRLAGPALRADSESMPFTGGLYRFAAPNMPSDVQTVAPNAQALIDAWGRMWSTYRDPPRNESVQIYRAASVAGVAPEVLTAWRWRLGLWTQDDRKSFDNYVSLANESRIAKLHHPVEALGIHSSNEAIHAASTTQQSQN